MLPIVTEPFFNLKINLVNISLPEQLNYVGSLPMLFQYFVWIVHSDEDDNALKIKLMPTITFYLCQLQMKEIDGGFDKDSRLKSLYSDRVSQYVISKNVE